VAVACLVCTGRLSSSVVWAVNDAETSIFVA
jgi:hypothetical protein